jgi:hypothetical protein
MTSLERLQAARRQLRLVSVGKALVWTLLAALLSIVLIMALDLALGLTLAARARLIPAPWLATIGTLGWHLAGPVRDALRATDAQVALWFERRIPTLRYALVTQAELGDARRSEALERVVSSAPLEGTLAEATRTAFTRPTLSVALLGVLLLLMPAGAIGRVVAPSEGDALNRPDAVARAAGNPLATIVVRVQPPSYSGLAAQSYDDPSTVAALIGSRVTIEGLGSGVQAIRNDVSDSANVRGDRWRIALPVPARAEAVRLTANGRERVLVLEPIADSVPVVRLDAPARDTVLRVARGSLALAADVRDDLGLLEGAFEIIISAGGGELYTFRTIMVGTQRFDAGVKSAQLAGAVRLDSLGLKPGDLMHMRAIARDRNDVAGPGRGASETRTVRIARADEYDSVSVDPAPPSEPEKDAMSQRMILQQTQELVAERRRISAATLTQRSRRIAIDQTKLRKKVGEVVFTRLGEDGGGEHEHFAGDGHEHAPEGKVDPDALLAAAERAANVDPTRNLDHDGDETPVVAINRPLLEAYNHMWRAGEELELGAPERAIPWMQRAIEALQRARAAERIYLRGRPPRVVVDINRVRLAGKDEARPSPRTPRAALDPVRAARLARFDAALGVVATSPLAAADSLLLIRVTLPTDDRAAALALDAAATALRRGGVVTDALVAARRSLVQDPPRRAPLTAWGY